MRWVSIAILAVLLLLLSSCMMDGPPKVHKTNVQPYGKYVCEAGALTFMEEGSVAPSGECGYVDVTFAPEYIYLLGGRENNKCYDFRLDEQHGDSDRKNWYIYDFSKTEDGWDAQEAAFLNFVWDRNGWNTGEDTVTLQCMDDELIFKWYEDK